MPLRGTRCAGTGAVVTSGGWPHRLPQVTRAEWSSENSRWTVHAEAGPERAPVRLTCNFLYTCTGYYVYASGYTPTWPGTERFGGRVIHPQHWPEDLDDTGKRVIVIGSGATAVTLVPSLAERAAHVTMLQRSPTYIAEQPARDSIADWLGRVLPRGAAYAAARWKNVLRSMFFYCASAGSTTPPWSSGPAQARRLASTPPERARETLPQWRRSRLVALRTKHVASRGALAPKPHALPTPPLPARKGHGSDAYPLSAAARASPAHRLR